MTNPLRWRGHEVSRLEGFSDTVFAFALTLLVVALEVPKNADELIRLMMEFPAFACCFALLIWIWWEHNTFFRRFGLQDAYTTALNAALLFVVLLYVYPLKFMFRALFAQFMPALEPVRMELYQFANIAAVYSSGFIAVFVLFALMHLHAYRSREKLGLTELQIFDARSAIGHHVVSIVVGMLSLIVALGAPLQFVWIAPTVFFLMGPGHAFYGWRSGRERAELEAELAGTTAAPAASV